MKTATSMIAPGEKITDAIEWGIAIRTAPGEKVSGDDWIIKNNARGVLIAVVDGLGHGDEATMAARVAVETLASRVDDHLMTQANLCHEALRQTRGVVMTVASINVADQSVTWMGIGNVEGILLHTDNSATPQRESVLLRGGVVGYQMPTFSATIASLHPGDLLIFATDGVRNGFADKVILRDSPQQIADRLMNQHYKGMDDALVLVVRFRGSDRE